MNLKQTLVDLYQLGITDTELDNGVVIEDITVQPGQYPTLCSGFICAIVDGKKVKYPYRLPCQGCSGCD